MSEVAMRIPYICGCTRYTDLSVLTEEGARKEMEELGVSHVTE